jgi:hypothetical protein
MVILLFQQWVSPLFVPCQHAAHALLETGIVKILVLNRSFFSPQLFSAWRPSRQRRS